MEGELLEKLNTCYHLASYLYSMRLLKSKGKQPLGKPNRLCEGKWPRISFTAS